MATRQTPGKNKVRLSVSGVRPGPEITRTVKHRALRMLAALGLDAAELSLVICGDRYIQKLNRQFRNMDKATDVLAFPQWDPQAKSGNFLLGDVVISRSTARRQARLRGVSELDEITYLLGHGLLHLLGMDHRTDAEERAMKVRNDMLCAAARGGQKTVDKRKR